MGDRWGRTFFVNFSVRSNINMTIRVRPLLSQMSNKQAELFKREIEYLKRSVGKMNNDNFNYQDLLEIAKDIINNFK